MASSFQRCGYSSSDTVLVGPVPGIVPTIRVCLLGRSQALWQPVGSPWSEWPAGPVGRCAAWVVVTVSRPVRARPHSGRPLRSPWRCGRSACLRVSDSRRRQRRQFQVRDLSGSELLRFRVFDTGPFSLRRIGSLRCGLAGSAGPGPRPSRWRPYLVRLPGGPALRAWTMLVAPAVRSAPLAAPMALAQAARYRPSGSGWAGTRSVTVRVGCTGSPDKPLLLISSSHD